MYPPATRTLKFQGRSVAVKDDRAVVMAAEAVNVAVAGSYRSDVLTGAPAPVVPPARSTVPSGRSNAE